MSVEGVTIGGAAVHHQQALVLINANDATSKKECGGAGIMTGKSGEKFMSGWSLRLSFIGRSAER